MDHQDKLLAFRKEIFELVAQNEIPEALGRLLAIYPSTDGTYYDDLLLLSRQYKDLIDRQSSGLLDDGDANIEKNRISHGLINMVNNLHTDPVVADHFGLAHTDDDQTPPAEGNKNLPGYSWPIVAVLAALVIVGVFLISDRESTEGEPVVEGPPIETPQNPSQPEQKEIIPDKAGPEGTQDNENTKPNPLREQARIDLPATEVDDPPASSPPTSSSHSSPERAKALPTGVMTSETLLSSTDVHHFSFRADQDGRVDLRLINRSSAFTPTLSIFNPDGHRLIGTRARKGENLVTWFRTEKGAEYRLEIGVHRSDPGSYTLELAYP